MSFTEWLNGLADDAARLAAEIGYLHRELAELRDEMRGSLRDDRQLNLLEHGRNAA